MENEQEQDVGIEEPEETEVIGSENETMTRELESSRAAIAGLERELESRNAEVAVLNQSLEEARKAVDELGKSLPEAVAAYKGLVVQANPGVPVEMIAGDSIEAVNESLASARTLVERVRREIEAEAARTRIPAGAPQRTPPDMSALSAREKIQYALGGG
jgi:predicted RNase H-like nuclease (RuvC/YqgF family)